MKIGRILVLLAFLSGISNTLPAQEGGTWSDLNRLRAGQKIQVVETNMKRHDGRFVAATDELLSFKEGGSDVSIKRNDVARVSTSSGGKRAKHALAGLLIGGCAGAGIGALSGSNHGFLGGSSRGLTAAVGTVIGLPSGAAVGAALPAHNTIYRASPERTAQTRQR